MRDSDGIGRTKRLNALRIGSRMRLYKEKSQVGMVGERGRPRLYYVGIGELSPFLTTRKNIPLIQLNFGSLGQHGRPTRRRYTPCDRQLPTGRRSTPLAKNNSMYSIRYSGTWARNDVYPYALRFRSYLFRYDSTSDFTHPCSRIVQPKQLNTPTPLVQ